MARIYISIGSNINPAENVQQAVKILREHFSDVEVSPVYESEAIGFKGSNFLNLVVAANTELDVYATNTLLHKIEDEHGRDRSGPRFSSRTIDLDLLLYDDLILHESGLEIPRDEILQNAFVLWPLADVAADYIHPQQGKSMAELWQAFDKQSQKLWPIELEF